MEAIYSDFVSTPISKTVFSTYENGISILLAFCSITFTFYTISHLK